MKVYSSNTILSEKLDLIWRIYDWSGTTSATYDGRARSAFVKSQAGRQDVVEPGKKPSDLWEKDRRVKNWRPKQKKKKKQPFATTFIAFMSAPSFNYVNTTKVLNFRETHVDENNKISQAVNEQYKSLLNVKQVITLLPRRGTTWTPSVLGSKCKCKSNNMKREMVSVCFLLFKTQRQRPLVAEGLMSFPLLYIHCYI